MARTRGEGAGCSAIDRFDRPKSKRHGNLRRLRQQGSRCEMDRGADHAVIVGVVSGLLCRRRRGGLRTCGGEPADCVSGVARMHVAKRQGDLQRQREQCEL